MPSDHPSIRCGLITGRRMHARVSPLKIGTVVVRSRVDSGLLSRTGTFRRLGRIVAGLVAIVSAPPIRTGQAWAGTLSLSTGGTKSSTFCLSLAAFSGFAIIFFTNGGKGIRVGPAFLIECAGFHPLFFRWLGAASYFDAHLA